ncbi:hypothetical protein BC938DRAFT_475382 [Jimgerdemannia flammicorona]|uniref:Uncharacterized protein n=1 Tax=Jimgerdemannia flammicorona TaxID=994334 RepID=A0A433QRP7_9FUNG|nr:hypothetical protein BC938DRAFT_475382 [Jimgerdemannia flammicorona]
MPHKRAKASVRASRTNEHDEVPTSELRDMPRRFAAVMKAHERLNQRKNVKKAQGDGGDGTKGKRRMNSEKSEHAAELRIHPGESFRNFSRRVDEEMQARVLHSVREGRSTSVKKKQYREKQKQKQKAKRQRQIEEAGARDWDDLRDEVKFGEVADAPPTITAVPKARGKTKKDLAQSLQPPLTNSSAAADAGSDSDSTLRTAKPTTVLDRALQDQRDKNRQRLKGMSEATRRVLDQERERVIAGYRAVKAKKMIAAGLTPMV